MGGARNFDGATDNIIISDSTSLRSPSTAITIGLWHKVPSSAGQSWAAIIAKQVNGGSNPWQSYTIQQKKLSRGVYVGSISAGTSGSQVDSGNTTPLTGGVWYYFVLRWAQGEAVNLDVYNEDGTLNQNVSGATTSLTIGYDTGTVRLMQDEGTSNLGGDLAHVLIDDTKWTDDQIQMVLRGRLHKLPSGLFMPVRGDATEPEFSGNANTGTVSGSTVVDAPMVGRYIPYRYRPTVLVSAPPAGGLSIPVAMHGYRSRRVRVCG